MESNLQPHQARPRIIYSSDIGADHVLDTAEFWIGQASHPDEILLAPQDIEAFNRENLDSDPHLVELGTYPDRISGAAVLALIQSASKPPAVPYHYEDGKAVTPADYERYTRRMALGAIGDDVDVRFALVTRRSNMRTWPTARTVFSSNGNPELDRFQENGLFPADAVAVLHDSADGDWCFVQSYNYAAWTPRDQLAFGERESVFGYRDAECFRVVIASRTTMKAGDDELQLDMGVRLPAADDTGPVRLPVRDEEGRLGFVSAALPTGDHVRSGYLPYTRANILRQAFKFLGEHYGWGHSLNARDCTGLVLEVFKSMGILLPRNSWQQGHGELGRNVRFTEHTPQDEKIRAVLAAEPGDLIYSTGHVMIYLGALDGKPYVIHDTAGAGQLDELGRFNDREYTGVSVSPLVSLHNSPHTTYLDETYAIKQIR